MDVLHKQKADVLVMGAENAGTGKMPLRDLLMESSFSIVLVK